MSSEPKQVRIVIASGSSLIRDGLTRLLESEADLKVLSVTSDAEAVTLVRQVKPDILLLDWAIPKSPGLEAFRELSAPADVTPLRVILLVAAAEISQIAEALRLGAKGVVNKDSVTEMLQVVKAVRTVMAGEYWVEGESVSNLVRYLRTLMEFEIISAVGAGHSNREIAELLKISENTLKHYLYRIFDKLGIYTRSELAHWAATTLTDGGRDDADEAGIAVKRPKSPNLNSGSAAARLDDVFDDWEGIGYGGAPPTRCHSRGELPPTAL